MDLDTIHDSLINGQRKQMVEQIDEYGPVFWERYEGYLEGLYMSDKKNEWFKDAVISYHRIKNI